MDKFNFILFLLLVIFPDRISSKSKNQPLKLQIHLALLGFLISQKKGEFPKNINQHLQKHSQKNFENNISIQENHFLPGRRRVFQAAEEFWKANKDSKILQYFAKLEQHHLGGQRMEEQQEAHQEHPTSVIVKILNITHLYASSSFKSHIILRGCGDRGVQQQTTLKKGEKTKINFWNCSHSC